MLEYISWQNFLTTVAFLVGTYYLVATIVLYNKEIVNAIKGNKLQNDNGEGNTIDSALSKNDLLGKTQYHTPLKSTTETISLEEISFQSATSKTEEMMPVSTSQKEPIIIGTIADLIQEVKTLAGIIQGNEKEEVVALFKSLLAHYPNLVHTQYQHAINIYIYSTLKEQEGFDLKPQDINTWWNEENALQ